MIASSKFNSLIAQAKNISVLAIASHLGIQVSKRQAMCFSGHDKSTPSLSFNTKSNTWKCFGACGKGGDTIQLVMEVLDIDFKGALSWIEREFLLRGVRAEVI